MGAARTGWWALLLALALVAIGVQLDRASRRDAGLAFAVPEPLRGFAFVPLAAEALERDEAGEALALSRALVLARPVSEEHLTLLALAATAAGDGALARRALAEAGTRGWREPLAQAALADAALAAGRPDIAGERLLALWIMGERGVPVAEGLDRVLATAEGRTTVSHWMSRTPREAANLAGWGARALAAQPLAQTVKAALAEGAPIGCEGLGAMTHRMLRRGEAGAARLLWSGRCARGALADLADTSFVPADGNALNAPLGWQAEPEAAFEPAGPRLRLRYDNRAPATRKIAERLSALAPGPYRVSAKPGTDRGPFAVPPRLDVVCIARGGGERTIAAVRLDPAGELVAIPARGCPVQNFKLMAPAGRGAIRDLAIRRTGEGA